MARRNAVQVEIPGTEQAKIPSIESAAETYVEKRDLWLGIGREVAEWKQKLLDAVHAHKDELEQDTDGSLYYTRGDIRITVEVTEKLKVKIAGEDEPEEE